MKLFIWCPFNVFWKLLWTSDERLNNVRLLGCICFWYIRLQSNLITIRGSLITIDTILNIQFFSLFLFYHSSDTWLTFSTLLIQDEGLLWFICCRGKKFLNPFLKIQEGIFVRIPLCLITKMTLYVWIVQKSNTNYISKIEIFNKLK